MTQKLANVTVLVKDYDEAIKFYTEKLNFILVEDTKLGDTKRWVLVTPGINSGSNLLLAKAITAEEILRVGNQTGGRVFLFLYTDNFKEYFEFLKSNNVKIIREPVKEIYGTVAVFEDLYGNNWDLIEPS
jgi:catechol 2,3-dioxygenase-like lactoylglutathione lyase family enzyme